MTFLVETARSPSLAPTQGRRTAARFSTFLVIATLLVVSAPVLQTLGIPYDSSSGSIFTKIHPASYLAVVAVLMWAWASGGLGRLLGPVAIRHPGTVMMAAGAVLLLFQAAVVVKLPLAPIIDTFILPLLLFVALLQPDEDDRRRLEVVLHTAVLLNSLLGLVEYASGWRLTPMYEADGTIIGYDWRASALFGHPLANAFVTGNYLVALAYGAAPRLPPAMRLTVMAIAGLAMIAFGGRVAMVTAAAMVVLAVVLGGFGLLAGRRFELRQAVLAIAFVTVTAIFVVIFVDSGAADRFIDRFNNDHGSAQTRLAMFHIFGNLTSEQFLLWPDPDLISQAQREYSLRLGVESSEVGFVAKYGLLVSLFFFVSLAGFLREVAAATSRRTWWSIAYFVIVMSSSLGVAAKTTVLAMFVLFALVLMRRAGGATD